MMPPTGSSLSGCGTPVAAMRPAATRPTRSPGWHQFGPADNALDGRWGGSPNSLAGEGSARLSSARRRPPQTTGRRAENGRALSANLTHPDPRKPRQSANDPSPALAAPPPPSEGERDGVRGHALVPRLFPSPTCGSGVVSLFPQHHHQVVREIQRAQRPFGELVEGLHRFQPRLL